MERVHFDAGTEAGKEGLENWFTSHKAFWKEIIETSGVEKEHQKKFLEALSDVKTVGWAHGDERADYSYFLLSKWSDYLTSVSPAILIRDAEDKQKATSGIEQSTLLTPEESSLLTLYQQLREDVGRAINRKEA